MPLSQMISHNMMMRKILYISKPISNQIKKINSQHVVFINRNILAHGLHISYIRIDSIYIIIYNKHSHLLYLPHVVIWCAEFLLRYSANFWTHDTVSTDFVVYTTFYPHFMKLTVSIYRTWVYWIPSIIFINHQRK